MTYLQTTDRVNIEEEKLRKEPCFLLKKKVIFLSHQRREYAKNELTKLIKSKDGRLQLSFLTDFNSGKVPFKNLL